MKICKLDECLTKMYALEFCKKHYDRVKKYGDPNIVTLRVKQSDLTCLFEDCDNPAYCKDMCNGHYQRNRNGVDSERPIGKAWREYPFKFVNSRGYVIVRHSRDFSGDIAEHRMVMEEVIGRPLAAGENVHHKNGVKTDNRPGNLELWSVSQPAGQKVSDKIRWAKEILEEYGTDESQYEF